MPGSVTREELKGRPTLYPLGDHAVTVQFGTDITLETHAVVRAFTRLLDERRPGGIVEYVAGPTTVNVLYDPTTCTCGDIVEELNILASAARPDSGKAVAPAVEIPVCYGGDFGPDLDFVASHTGLPADRVVEIHSGAEYLVHMIGFVPGFPYLGGLDERLATPRRESPRAVVPPGSVAVAGRQTGIYPSEAPGGWQLIGRTPTQLFSPYRDPPSLLHAGDRVRFVAITRDEFDRLARDRER